MATLLHRALENLCYWTEQISPTDTRSAARFARFDSTKHKDPPAERQSSGWMRVFKVRWRGSSAADEDVTDRYERTADHNVQVRVHYPIILDEERMRALILQDRHDLYKCWRDDNKFVGWDADNLTDKVLMDRIPISDELDDTSPFQWVVIYSLTMRHREVED